VSISAPGYVPPGWYPDPSGERAWRVWTGSAWSELTRPYGEPVVQVPLLPSLALIQALHRLRRYGIVAVLSGIGLIVSVLAHWPGTDQPTPLWFAVTATDTGVALVLIGTVLFAFAFRELVGHWTPLAFLPGLNMLATGALVFRRLGHRSPGLRVVTQALLIALFVANAHSQPWLGVALVIVAIDQMQWTSALVERLAGPATLPSSSAP